MIYDGPVDGKGIVPVPVLASVLVDREAAVKPGAGANGGAYDNGVSLSSANTGKPDIARAPFGDIDAVAEIAAFTAACCACIKLDRLAYDTTGSHKSVDVDSVESRRSRLGRRPPAPVATGVEAGTTVAAPVTIGAAVSISELGEIGRSVLLAMSRKATSSTAVVESAPQMLTSPPSLISVEEAQTSLSSV
jgi:hypothetical protein